MFQVFQVCQVQIVENWVVRKPDQTKTLEENCSNQIFLQQIRSQTRPDIGRIQGPIDRENLKFFYAHCLKSRRQSGRKSG